MQPIFLQTMFRSGGTWLWSRFRTIPSFRCYYEPLHPTLMKLQAADARGVPQNAATEFLRHPALDRPYFAELPLLAEGGVPLFRPQFSWQHMVLGAADEHPSLERYLRFLVDVATFDERRPVMKFVRAGLRSAWLRDRFAPLQIFLCRDPFSLMRSYQSFPVGHFVEPVLRLVTEGRMREPFRTAFQRLMPPEVEVKLPTGQSRIWAGKLEPVMRLLPEGWLLEVVAIVWLAHLAAADEACDLILDYDRLVGEDPYRVRMQALLQDLTASPITLDDIDPAEAAPDPPAIDDATLERLRDVARRPEFAPAARVAEQLGGKSRMFVETLLG